MWLRLWGWAVREEAIQTVSFSSPPFLLAIIFFVIFDCLRFARRVQTIFHFPHIPVMEAFSSSAQNYLVGRTFLSFFFLESFPADFSFSLRFFSLETKCLAVYHFDSSVFIYICHPPSMGSSQLLACTSNPRPGSALLVVVVL